MPKISVKVDTKQAIANVKKYQFHKLNNLQDAIYKTAFLIDEKAKKEVVVDTGRLRASIHPEFRGENQTSYSYSDKPKPKHNKSPKTYDGKLSGNIIDRLEAVVGTNVEYAQKQETLKPFLNPAFQIGKAFLEKEVAKILKNI